MMDLNIEDLNKVISAFVSNTCSDQLTEQCLKKLILYTSENDILLSHLSSILISAKNQVNCLFKSLTALHYTINKGDPKFLHYLASNNLNFVNLEKHKHKFNDVNADYLAFLRRYVKYLQQKISVYKFINMESSWLIKLTQKSRLPPAAVPVKSDESVLQHDIIGEQLMRKIGYIESQIDYLIGEFNADNLRLLFDDAVLESSDAKTKCKLIELVFSLLLSDVINYANFYQDIMSELIEQFELMNRKHCKDAIEVYRKLPDKVEMLRNFLLDCNRCLLQANGFQAIDLSELIEPSVELQEKMENHWNLLESKPKRKNSERRKEKSKYAARIRRGEESDLLNELSELVPLPDVKLQDKASVMRLAIAFINTKQFVQNYFQVNNSANDSTDDASQPKRPAVAESDPADLFDAGQMDDLDVLKTSNLILALLSLEGDLVFISPNVINLIGLKQTEMLGMSIFDFVHPCDHDELKGALKQISEENAATNSAQSNDANANCSMKSLASLNEMNRGAFDSKNLFREHNKYVSFMVRIKCTLNNKSKCVPLKSANYKMASFSGYLKDSKSRPLLVLSVDILLSPSAQLKCADSSVFVTKHTPDLKFINTDEKLTSLFGYDEKDLVGYSFFQYIHASDAFQLFNSFQKLLSKGEVETGYYRFLCKHGGYFWLQTKASLLTDYSTQKPQTILCVHYLISELISSGIILSSKQSLLTKSSTGADENSSLVSACGGKKGQRLAKKTKASNQSKITKTNLNSKVLEKCYSPNKAARKSANKATDDLFVLKDNSNLPKKAAQQASPATSGNSSSDESGALVQDHFVQDCREFDDVLEKIKFKEQFKRQYEAQLNSRMAKQTVEPLFNTLSVFEPLAKEDSYCQSEPSINNSPLIATPSSIAYASKVDMACMVMPFELSNDVTYDLGYELSPASDLSSSSGSYDLFEPVNACSSEPTASPNFHIPEIDELKTSIGHPNSIFSPLTDDLNSSYYLTGSDEEKLAAAGKKIDFDSMNLLHLAPQAGDSCMSLDVSMDFDELPVNLDPETEKLIREIGGFGTGTGNFTSVQSAQQLNSTTAAAIESARKEDRLAFDNYRSHSKPVKHPNHFRASEITKKARTSLSALSSPANRPTCKINSSSSVLLNLLISDDVGKGYLGQKTD